MRYEKLLKENDFSIPWTTTIQVRYSMASLIVLVGTLYAIHCVYDGNENVPSAGTERVDSIVCGNPCISRLYTVDLPAWRMHSAT